MSKDWFKTWSISLKQKLRQRRERRHTVTSSCPWLKQKKKSWTTIFPSYPWKWIRRHQNQQSWRNRCRNLEVNWQPWQSCKQKWILESELAALTKLQAEMEQIRQESHSEYSQAKEDLEQGLNGILAQSAWSFEGVLLRCSGTSSRWFQICCSHAAAGKTAKPCEGRCWPRS